MCIRDREFFSEKRQPSGRKEEEEERAEQDKYRTRQADASIIISADKGDEATMNNDEGDEVTMKDDAGARYWGSDKERAERWAERTMRAESLKVVYPVVDDGLDYAPGVK